MSEAIEGARTYRVLKVDDSEFEVIFDEGSNVVKIRSRWCVCVIDGSYMDCPVLML